jgi:hypothetical protein
MAEPISNTPGVHFSTAQLDNSVSASRGVLCMKVSFSIITSIILVLGHCFSPAASGLNQNTSQKHTRVIDSLPPPNDQEIRKIRTAEQWRNPYIVVCRDGFELILHNEPRSQVLLSLNELEKALLKMSREQWPLGKVVAVQENGLRSPGDDPKIERNLKAVIRMFGSHKIRIDRWPSV